MDLSGSAMSIPDENLKLFVPLRRNLGNIEFGLALVMSEEKMIKVVNDYHRIHPHPESHSRSKLIHIYPERTHRSCSFYTLYKICQQY